MIYLLLYLTKLNMCCIKECILSQFVMLRSVVFHAYECICSMLLSFNHYGPAGFTFIKYMCYCACIYFSHSFL